VGFLPKNQVACILPECVLTWLNHLSVFNPCANTQEVGGAEVPMQFRFVIKPRTKVNCFTPKQMDDGDLTNVRYSQFGGCFQEYHKLDRSTAFGIMWEAGETQKTKW